ncbi:MAG: histone deacetylase family protein, partial [Alphaproteobacteria bacterium]
MHAESPQRLRSILAALGEAAFEALDRRQAPLADLTQIELVHPRRYIDDILANIPAAGHHALDPDTIVSPASGSAALHAVGAVIAATDDVMTGRTTNAFCAIRPPGHHAEPGRVMGFCLFNSVAIAAAHARDVYGIERVAVVDFDVHHGNGTQAAFADDANLFYASTHQSPLYPGTGSPGERGIAGNIVNAPLPPGAGSAEFRRAFTDIVLPQL